MKGRCKVEDCLLEIRARGFCNTHYKRWKKWGDPLVHGKDKRGHCSVEDCESLHVAKGFCAKHYYDNFGHRARKPAEVKRVKFKPAGEQNRIYEI